MRQIYFLICVFLSASKRIQRKIKFIIQLWQQKWKVETESIYFIALYIGYIFIFSIENNFLSAQTKHRKKLRRSTKNHLVIREQIVFFMFLPGVGKFRFLRIKLAIDFWFLGTISSKRTISYRKNLAGAHKKKPVSNRNEHCIFFLPRKNRYA